MAARTLVTATSVQPSAARIRPRRSPSSIPAFYGATGSGAAHQTKNLGRWLGLPDFACRVEPVLELDDVGSGARSLGGSRLASAGG